MPTYLCKNKDCIRFEKPRYESFTKMKYENGEVVDLFCGCPTCGSKCKTENPDGGVKMFYAHSKTGNIPL